jgi:hypothetical protein
MDAGASVARAAVVGANVLRWEEFLGEKIWPRPGAWIMAGIALLLPLAAVWIYRLSRYNPPSSPGRTP